MSLDPNKTYKIKMINDNYYTAKFVGMLDNGLMIITDKYGKERYIGVSAIQDIVEIEEHD